MFIYNQKVKKNDEFNFRGVKNLIYSQQHSVYEVLVDSPLINGVVGWSFFISSDSNKGDFIILSAFFS